MESREIYTDIAARTGGDIYIGVVGPVRCGKSTFIKRFMETSVIPGIEGEYDKKRATDELPQSAAGKTVMTAEPKLTSAPVPFITMPEVVDALSAFMILSLFENATLPIEILLCVAVVP